MSRPFALDPLFTSLKTLGGVGPKLLKLYEKLCGPAVIDVLYHMPSNLIDRRYSPSIENLERERIATLKVTVHEHVPGSSRHRPWRVRCSDDTGGIDLVFFHPRKDWLLNQLPVGQQRVVSGRIEFYHGRPQMAHPDAMGLPEELEEIATVEPVYPLTAGLTHKRMLNTVRAGLARLPHLPEWIDPALIKQRGWPDWHNAVQTAHHPQDFDDLEGITPARQRLAYDELLASQLSLRLVRHYQTRSLGRSFKPDAALKEKLLKALPFTLTGAQQRAIEDIEQDMALDDRMLRLVQGDVGSGKTIVGLFAMLNAVANGAQAAFMAPTEILARQHAETMGKLCDAIGVSHVVLTGRDKGKSRSEILEKIQNGDAKIIIGTHALFQDDVVFNDLGLAIIDEQHRFGVHQRLQFSEKGTRTDILVMTATPIPRSLTLAAYGDMDISRLDEKPAGRKPIDTRIVSLDRIDDVISGLKRKISEGERIYWVCPLVEDSEKLDLAAAEERYRILSMYLDERVGLVHGRMKAAEKDEVMDRFKNGQLDVLVATTVIEVGVDVPEATVMVIEHAERFGLSQLHQLRGRVGRGDKPSSCLLLFSPKSGETARLRLSTIRDTEDGFVIAEEDLKIRGAGDVLGTRQSGMPEFRLASLSVHADLMQIAQSDAKMIIANDPQLKSERGQALRTLLYLFRKENAVKYLRSG